jgi:hypothetical protein
MNYRRRVWRNLIRMAGVGALALLPLGARALDLTPDASRVLSDPSYLPLGGRLFGSTQFNFNQLGSNTANYQGAPLSSNSTLTTTLNQLFEFGVTDELSLRVSGVYQVQGITNTSSSGASTVTTSTGFGDPNFAATWRFLDEKDRPFNWDLIGVYAPNLISAQNPSTDQFGSVARGGAVASLGTALSYKTKGFTAYGHFLATYFDSRDILNPTTSITTTYEASWQYAFDVTTQTRLGGGWSLNAGVSQTYVDNADASFTNASGKLFQFTGQPGGLTMLTASLNYQVTAGGFVASLLYSHDFYGDSGNDFATLPKSDTTTSGKQSDIYGAMVRYVFN